MFTLQMTAMLLAVTFAVTMAFPVEQPIIPIVKQSNEVNPDGSFRNEFETANGISVEQVGYQKNDGGPEPIQVIQGRDTYTAPDGKVVNTVYTADENGFQAYGDHLPTAPTPHPAILKALAYLATLPSTPEPL